MKEIKECLNFTYYKERLSNVNLLFEAIIIDNDLAVPVGGSRRGGWCLGTQKGLTELKQYPSKYPNVRIEKVNDRDYLVWGPQKLSRRTSMKEEAEAGIYYGYTKEAIDAFLIKNYNKTLKEVMS